MYAKMIFTIFVGTSLLFSLDTGPNTVVCDLVVMQVQAGQNNIETKIEFPSFEYRINLLLYFVFPVLILLILLILKIRQLDLHLDDDSRTN